MASIPCDEDDGVATRVCSPDNGGQWMEPDISQCGGPTDNSMFFSFPLLTCQYPSFQDIVVKMRVCVSHKTGFVMELHTVT